MEATPCHRKSARANLKLTPKKDHDHEDEHDHGPTVAPPAGYLDDDEHDHDEDEDFALITAKIGVLVGSMYAMWFIGAMMHLYGIGHGHSHGLGKDLHFKFHLCS